jgi:uncharacterized protein (TIGR00369 family)
MGDVMSDGKTEELKTHRLASMCLVGKVIELGDGYSRVKLECGPEMAVDEKGLIHGGFTFGCADLAAMVAVNHPNVVLGKAEVRFTKPIRVGDIIEAEARVVEVSGKRHVVDVIVKRGGETVLEGKFYCYVLEKHVLD